jgi:hypothetical protein
MTEQDMLSIVDLAKGAIERQPSLLIFAQAWVGKALHREADWVRWKHGLKNDTES